MAFISQMYINSMSIDEDIVEIHTPNMSPITVDSDPEVDLSEFGITFDNLEREIPRSFDVENVREESNEDIPQSQWRTLHVKPCNVLENEQKEEEDKSEVFCDDETLIKLIQLLDEPMPSSSSSIQHYQSLPNISVSQTLEQNLGELHAENELADVDMAADWENEDMVPRTPSIDDLQNSQRPLCTRNTQSLPELFDAKKLQEIALLASGWSNEDFFIY